MTTYIKGKKLEISVYFAALVTLIFALSPKGSAPTGFVCCLLHEVGHLVAMKIVGCRVQGIAFGLYGMRIDCESGVFLPALKEAVVALGGPIANIFLAVAGLIFKNEVLISSNVALACFNLLPVESTDGHSALKCILKMHFEEEKIKTALRIISAAFLFLVYCFGFLLLLKSRYNFSALIVAAYLTVKFLFQGSQPYR